MSRSADEMGEAILEILYGLQKYARAHEKGYNFPISDDRVLGDEWLTIAKGLEGLLDGETGRHDPGRIWSQLHDLGLRYGFSKRELDEGRLS